MSDINYDKTCRCGEPIDSTKKRCKECGAILDKRIQMNCWLAENPGKTKRDWLLEARCATAKERAEFQEFLKFCDENNINLRIPSFHKYIGRIPVDYDFEIVNFGFVYDLGVPEELYTCKNGFNEGGWQPFLNWKWQQVTDAESFALAPDDLEKNHYDQYVNSYCYKWNHPVVLEALKKFSETK